MNTTFPVSDRRSKRSKDGWYCRWPWVTFEGHFRYYKRVYRFYRFHVCIEKNTALCNDRSQLQRLDIIASSYASRIRSEGLLDDAERNLLAIAKFLIFLKFYLKYDGCPHCAVWPVRLRVPVVYSQPNNSDVRVRVPVVYSQPNNSDVRLRVPVVYSQPNNSDGGGDDYAVSWGRQISLKKKANDRWHRW